MDFAFSDEQIILRDSVRKMMDRLATPDYVRRLDREQAYPDALYAAWVEMGLLRLPFAEEYGGLGGSALDMVVLADEMARKSFDFFTAYGGSVFCGLNVAQGLAGAEELLVAEAAVGRNQDVDLDVRARCGLRPRLDADRRAP